VKQGPDHADCWAMLSWLYRAEYTHGYNARPDAMDRALAAARRAVNLAPSSQLAHAALASSHFFRGEIGEFRAEAERALALNRMQGYTTAFLGLHFAYSGDWEHGCAVVEKALHLNPNHPGWFWLPLAMNAYRAHEGQRALEYTSKINMPGLWTAQVALAVVNSQLGQMEQARRALRDLLAIRPDFAAKAREELRIWWQPEMVEQMLSDLRKAGLGAPQAVVAPLPASGTAPARTASGESRTDEGFWVAVLPFKYTGGNADLTGLPEGLTEDIVMGLSRFSYLRVMSRSATLRTASDAEARSAGKELGARYVMEGSLRHAGSKVRIAVQLVDTNSGAHLWAENYERAFNPEAVFELQDDIAPRIVSTCGDSFGVLARSISDAVRGKASGQLTPYEALMRGFGYHHRLTAEEHAEARELLERAVEKAPGNADCWAMVSWVYSHEYGHGFNPRPGSLDRSLAASRRAVELAPSNHLAQQALAVALFFRKEKTSCLNAAERALALNPWDGSNEAIFLITFTGDWERGCALIKRSMELNPHHPGWYWVVLGVNEYRTSNYRGAVDAAVKAAAPDIHWTSFLRAAAYGQLGESNAAQEALHQLLAIKPDYAAEAREDLGKWFESELVEHIIGGLRKAGLDVPGESWRYDPMQSDPANLHDFAARYTTAWCSQDPTNVAECYSVTGSLTVNGGTAAVGRNAIAEVARSFMTKFPDMRVIMDKLLLQGDRVEYHWTLIGTNTGPGGTGNQVRISGFELWQIGEDGLIATSQGHFDAAEYRRQLEKGI
jgi:TolB-like protein/Flp pilus assembly protein TadD/nuclear transport factor 2 (NTF2) superfamily protein